MQIISDFSENIKNFKIGLNDGILNFEGRSSKGVLILDFFRFYGQVSEQSDQIAQISFFDWE